ncbi:transport protein particle subunit trs23 [Colletotrichum spaethianum]|uniref:Transport protein particle subunit trs23 n=1 Tax=Colletotrichum spaethianum TaxID=700344 RepID=A0AA37L5W8_9PEZI|nr:transport protein particle subunit trs23 [Colletotrichum spaethianum]GKT40755.1 transport protein particle subunit trs23 [Colletotrichum spaethianum]
MFSPLAFPDGAVFYELITHVPPPSHLALTPFDFYREPLAVIAIADGDELKRVAFNKRQSGNAPTVAEKNIRTLYQELEDLRDRFGKALVHQVLIFDHTPSKDNPVSLPEGLIAIPPPDECKRTTMKTIMCDITSQLLAEMTTLAKSFEAMSFIESPGQSHSTRQANSASWGMGDSEPANKRNSQFTPTPQRSSSTSGLPDRHMHRMSMPVAPMKNNSAMASSNSTPVRPSTPVRSGLSNPPTTFDDLTAGINSGSSTPDQNPRPGAGEHFRSESSDRVSVQGFGPGGLNDRWRAKGKGRVTILMGSLYLQAGRWPDALKELMEGATVARSINDHIWHGKALELVTITLLLLGWVKVEFQVPSICLPPQDKSTAATYAALEAATTDPSQPKYIRNLQIVLPDLLERILGLYSRISAEHLPPLPLAETTIRFSKILSALHLADGKLGERSYNIMIYGKLPSTPLTTSPRLIIVPSRQQIVTFLFRAFPSSSSELLTITDRVSILAGIASVLGPLGHHRKKAMVTRELVSVLISGLVEARTRGAADMGIHPAAGLVALNAANGHSNSAVALELGEGDVEQGIEAFLALLCKSYGIVGFDMKRQPSDDTISTEDSDAAVIDRIRGQAAARFFGFTSVKLNILRACINFSEALPDFNGVLKFSSDLLRTAGSGVAPGPRKEDASPVITRDEQIRLVTNISKTSNLSKRLGLNHLAAEYWDEFFVRGVALEPLPITRIPVPHAKSTLPGAVTARTSQDVNPFIYNPFLKQANKAAADHILVANEPATFKVTLQNPYDVEVDVESLRLDTSGAEFESNSESTIIGPYRTQILKVTGIPKGPGALKVTGAIIRVRGCRERRFPIFKEPWTPQADVKVKATGLPALESTISSDVRIGRPLKAEDVGFNVISQQPIVIVKSTTLPQASVMVLEGERQVFSVTLQNLSKTTPVDFMLFSFQDSTQGPLQAGINNRDATPAELYEYEYILMKRQGLRRLNKKEPEKRYIAPGGTATFDFEILGKPGLTNAAIQIDYAHLGMAPEEVTEQFHTRQVSLQLTVTVNASVELARLDILPLSGPVPRPLLSLTNLESKTDPATLAEEYCLLSMDLRNAWPNNMEVELDGEDGVVIEEHILPGNMSRVIVPLRRIHLEDPHASIPALNPSRQRQFVVSTSKITPDMERSNREAFWYREKILDTLTARWKTVSGPKRNGYIDLRSIRLSPRMMDALRIDDIGIKISVEDPNKSHSGTAKESVFVDTFVQIRVGITNRSAQPVYPMLRLMPALCHRPLNVALDFTRKFAWNGTLQQALPLLAAKSSTEVEIQAMALCRGEFEIGASVEEYQIWEEPKAEKDKEEKKESRQRSDTQTLLNAIIGAKERRIWHSRQPCVIKVMDHD